MRVLNGVRTNLLLRLNVFVSCGCADYSHGDHENSLLGSYDACADSIHGV